MQDIRLIALDLDGTVFNDQKQVTPRTVAAIRAALDKGVTVIPATGRTANGVPPEFGQMPGVRYALTSNGATVTELATGRRLVSLTFDAEQAIALYDALQEFGGIMALFVDGFAYAARSEEALVDKYVPENLRRYFKDTRILVDDVHATLREHPNAIEKFSIIYQSDAVRDAAWEKIASTFAVEATSSVPRNLELNAPGVTKGRGLMALAKELGLRREQVMACGDSGNDLAMIEQAGLGVAMGNATPDIIAAADYVTLDNNHDGVAAAIEKFVLN